MISMRKLKSRTLPIQRFLNPTDMPGVVLASYGRSGSTMLYQAIGNAISHERFGQRRGLVYDMSWTLAQRPPQRGTVCKTHDYPQALEGKDDLKSIFVFGSPIETVRSVILQHQTRGPEWVQEHFDHLKSIGRFEDLTTSDVLGIGAQLDAWTTFTS